MARVLIDRANPVKLDCPHCKSLVEFDINDWFYDDVGHSGDHFTCPACNKRIPYSFSRLPQRWKDQLADVVQ